MNAGRIPGGIGVSAVLLAAFLGPLPVSANQNPGWADVRVPPGPVGVIAGLRFPAAAAVRVEDRGLPGQKVTAGLGGGFSLAGWSLFTVGGKTLVPSDRASAAAVFQSEVVLTGVETSVDLVAVSPRGEIREESIAIVYPQYVGASLGANGIPSLGHSWNIGLGATWIDYSQTNLPSFTEYALTPKLSYQVPLSRGWDFGVNTFVTALPLSTTQPAMKAYFLGANARLGYTLPFVRKPWTLSVALGGYFTTMFTSGTTFGFRNMVGPRAFPVVRRSVSRLNSLAGYFKYSPVTTPGNSGFTSHELASGLVFTHLLPKARTVSATLDYSRISVNIAGASASSSSLTLGAAYGF